MSIFEQDGVMCINMSGFTTRHEALAAGFKWVAPILMHNPAAEDNVRDLEVNSPTYEMEGWTLGGWGTYGQSASPEDDASAAARLAVNLDLKFWIANGEAWAEGAFIDYSERFLNKWLTLPAYNIPIAVSCLSSTTDQFAREFDYHVWLDHGCMVIPQVYGNDIPGLTVQACLGSFGKAGVPQSAINMTFGTYTTHNPVPFADYQGWSGPRSVYTGDQTQPEMWAKLARTAARPDTPP